MKSREEIQTQINLLYQKHREASFRINNGEPLKGDKSLRKHLKQQINTLKWVLGSK